MSRVQKRPGVFFGLASFFRGIGFIAKTPRTWPLALVPAMVVALVTGVMFFAGRPFVLRWTGHLFDPSAGSILPSWLSAAGRTTVRFLSLSLLLVGSFILGTALAPPLSGSALDHIVKVRNDRLKAKLFLSDVGFFRSVFRSVRVALFSLAFGVPCVLFLTMAEWAFPPAVIVTWPTKLIVMSLLAAWNLLDYPLGLLDKGARFRIGWIFLRFWPTVGFGLGAVMVSVVPFLGLLLLPAGVAGATEFIAEFSLFDAIERARLERARVSE